MEPVESKITSKGQISVPAAVRKRLDLGPGTRIEWVEKDGEIVVRRASRFTSQEIHEAVFRTERPVVSVEEMDEGIKARMKKKHASR
ncbi:MAG: AbrB/MazE/SpoVT family DNA-binding domain-containing protein [Burkholderiaceae bacterium]